MGLSEGDLMGEILGTNRVNRLNSTIQSYKSICYSLNHME